MFSEKERKKSQKRRLYAYFVLTIVYVIFSPIIAETIDGTLTGIFKDIGNFQYDFNYWNCIQLLVESKNRKIITLAAYVLLMCFLFLDGIRVRPSIGRVGMQEVAHGIFTPVPAGNGQFGTARFMTDRELKKTFSQVTYKGDEIIKNLSENAGIIINYIKEGKKEVITYLTEAVNVIILGATRSGKTRRLLMTSTWLNLLAGVNLLVVDVKGEIYAFTKKFAKLLGYEIRTIDFRSPEKSMHFNNMAEIVRLLKEKKISDATDKAWDIVSVLVGEPKGERIWTDGQCATIAAAILIIAQDAPEKCKNLCNVYYFLAYMCEPDSETGEMAINDYIANLPDNHPARGAFQVAKIAPMKTRGSFFTSALSTLRLYTSWNVADVTSCSDYTFDDIDDKKVITYMIFPDEKTTYYPIGSIYIKQMYESLVAQATRKGGSLDRKFIFRADEVGNFLTIPGLGTMLSAGAGRNIFFELVLQDYQQLESKYKDDYRNIRTNCQLVICLKATEDQTLKEISTRLGNYTVEVSAASSSQSDARSSSTSYSNSSNLTGRPLLFPDEIADIEAPDALIMYGGKKAIVNLPDISDYYANAEFGMGDKEFNKKLYTERMEERESREIKEPKLWGVWKDYGVGEMMASEERVSFL